VSSFLSPLELKYVEPWDFRNNGRWNPNDGTARWQLTAIFGYYSTHLAQAVYVPLGFRTDGASVPTIVAIYARYGNRYLRAAVLHDFLCRQGYIERETCDQVFLEAMRLENFLEEQAMVDSGIARDEINQVVASIDGRALEMYLAVCAYSKTGLWKNETHAPGFEPVA
jgi:hypothetical protein